MVENRGSVGGVHPDGSYWDAEKDTFGHRFESERFFDYIFRGFRTSEGVTQLPDRAMKITNAAKPIIFGISTLAFMGSVLGGMGYLIHCIPLNAAPHWQTVVSIAATGLIGFHGMYLSASEEM